MKIASWNINSLRKRQERLLDWLAKEEPDVVCLQETKCSDDQFPELALSAAAYRCTFHGQKSYNGVAILSRHELRERQAALCDESEDPQARVIAATISNLRVFSIYAPNGQAVGSPAFRYKLQWFVQLRDCVVEAQKSFPQVMYAAISMSRRKIATCMIPRFGAAPSCVPRKNAPLFARSSKSVCAIPFAFIMLKAVFSVGGIIGCWRFKKIADCASMRSWQVNHWPNAPPPPGSIVRCAKARIRPITRRSGRNFLLRHPE